MSTTKPAPKELFRNALAATLAAKDQAEADRQATAKRDYDALVIRCADTTDVDPASVIEFCEEHGFDLDALQAAVTLRCDRTEWIKIAATLPKNERVVTDLREKFRQCERDRDAAIETAIANIKAECEKKQSKLQQALDVAEPIFREALDAVGFLRATRPEGTATLERLAEAQAAVREAETQVANVKANARPYLDPDVLIRGRASAAYLRAAPGTTFAGMPLTPAEKKLHEANVDAYMRIAEGQHVAPHVYAAETAALEAANAAYHEALADAEKEALTVI